MEALSVKNSLWILFGGFSPSETQTRRRKTRPWAGPFEHPTTKASNEMAKDTMCGFRHQCILVLLLLSLARITDCARTFSPSSSRSMKAKGLRGIEEVETPNKRELTKQSKAQTEIRSTARQKKRKISNAISQSQSSKANSKATMSKGKILVQEGENEKTVAILQNDDAENYLEISNSNSVDEPLAFLVEAMTHPTNMATSAPTFAENTPDTVDAVGNLTLAHSNLDMANSSISQLTEDHTISTNVPSDDQTRLEKSETNQSLDNSSKIATGVEGGVRQDANGESYSPSEAELGCLEFLYDEADNNASVSKQGFLDFLENWSARAVVIGDFQDLPLDLYSLFFAASCTSGENCINSEPAIHVNGTERQKQLTYLVCRSLVRYPFLHARLDFQFLVQITNSTKFEEVTDGLGYGAISDDLEVLFDRSLLAGLGCGDDSLSERRLDETMNILFDSLKPYQHDLRFVQRRSLQQEQGCGVNVDVIVLSAIDFPCPDEREGTCVLFFTSAMVTSILQDSLDSNGLLDRVSTILRDVIEGDELEASLVSRGIEGSN